MYVYNTQLFNNQRFKDFKHTHDTIVFFWHGTPNLEQKMKHQQKAEKNILRSQLPMAILVWPNYNISPTQISLKEGDFPS